MGTLSEIRDGLKTRLATATSLRAYDVWPDTFNPPGAIVRPVRFSYTALGGANTSGQYEFEVALAVQVGTLRTAQDELDSYLVQSGAKSIPAAIYGDRTLGGKCEDLVIMGWRDYQSVEINGVEYLSATIDVRVLV